MDLREALAMKVRVMILVMGILISRLDGRAVDPIVSMLQILVDHVNERYYQQQPEVCSASARRVVPVIYPWQLKAVAELDQ